MDVLVSLYNILLTVYLSFALACAIYLRRYKGGTIFAVIGFLFGFYLADNSIVFFTESIPDFAALYDRMFISSPSFKTICYLVLMGCIMYCVYAIMAPSTPYPFYAAMGGYACFLICIPLIPEPNWMVFFYFLTTQLTLIGISIWTLTTLRHMEADEESGPLPPVYKDFKRFMVFLLCICVLIQIEDSIVIFVFDVYSTGGLKINNRNVCENILFMAFATWILRYAISVLDGPAKDACVDPPDPEPETDLAPPVSNCNTSLQRFADTYGLTERECQILEQLLNGKGQQEISDTLIIALGKVKTHIHNIYQKIDVSKKGQLLDKFQEFEKTYQAAPPDGPKPPN